ncbi:MAG TPA: primosomal protein N' [Paracoccaceae bacterium]|nr:primosomal protein N' [Paracoccaceae bacterium]
MTDAARGRKASSGGGPARAPALDLGPPPSGAGPDGRFPEGALIAVLAPLPFDRTLDYRAPEGGVAPGDWVAVRVGPNAHLGVVWGPGSGDHPPDKVRAAGARVPLPPMPAETRDFLDRVADYTLTERGMVLRLATRAPGLAEPPGTRTVLARGRTTPERLTDARARVLDALDAADAPPSPAELARAAGVSSGVVKGLVEAGALAPRAAPRDAPYPALDPEAAPRPLSPAQAEAAAALQGAVAARRYSTTLLRGVTGSGKTEVYLEAVAECLRQGRQALILLPEIALTDAFLDRFVARFGALPAEWHSAVGERDRRRCWRAVAAGEARVVAGARSALFLPFADLGLVIVDEEHDTAYKQEEGALYNARDMGVLRAACTGAAVVLASATPSLETWANAEAGKYARLDLPERFGPAVMPAIRAIDLRADPPAKGRWIAPPLVAAVTARLERGEQALLFLNRRGYAPVTVCRACGEPVGCPHCDATLVEHRFRARLMCHQCGFERRIPPRCPACDAEDRLAPVGPGVERLAEEAAARWPEARLAVISSDIAESATALRARIAAVARGEADLIVGTQLVAKGHNFPGLTLVGVVDADLGLKGGDLRAAERTFQLMRQVAGRAGRADRPGEALLQTHAPEHPAIAALLDGDEEAFLREEAARRRDAGAPPYGRYAGVVVSGPDEARARRTAEALGRLTEPFAAIGATLYGPAPAPIARIRGRHRFRLLAKSPRSAPLQSALRAWRDAVRPEPGVTVRVDVDPQSFL